MRTKPRSHVILATIAKHLGGLGFKRYKGRLERPISDIAVGVVGLANQTCSDRSVAVEVHVGARFPELERIVTTMALPVAGSWGWRVSCRLEELTDGNGGGWTFPADIQPDFLAAEIAETVRRYALPAMCHFETYHSTIEELETRFPCLDGMRRLIIPLAHYALGDPSAALAKFRGFLPPNPKSSSDFEYVKVAAQFEAEVST